MSDTVKPTQKGRTLALIGLAAGLIAALAIPATGLGRMLGLWGPMPAMLHAFKLMGAAALVAILIGLWGLWRGYAPKLPVLGALALGIIMLALTGHTIYVARSLPLIHDITTDTLNPPQFVAVEGLRQAAKAPNSTDYDPSVGQKQRAAYPDLETRILAMPPDQAFDRALDAARAMGWEIVAAEKNEGRIEAYDTTFWAGYVDDVVIRLRPADDGRTALDIRSVSRMGLSDLGKNAARIRAYLGKLD